MHNGKYQCRIWQQAAPTTYHLLAAQQEPYKKATEHKWRREYSTFQDDTPGVNFTHYTLVPLRIHDKWWSSATK